ncbi:MAG: GNAT family N-acetyltransferase [Neisseria sp.]|nr:GNAT family N-acetyltransferase [Neisseria sp.]
MNTQNFRIQIAQASDLADIVAIYNSTIPTRQSTADLQPVSVESRRAWFEAHNEKRPIYVVKNAENQLLAWGSFSDYYPRDAYHISAEISVYVGEQARGQGLGKTLLQFMLQQAPSLGIRNVLAVIFAHNAASIALFEQAGFAKWGHLPKVCDLENQLADIVILGKCLAD